MGGVDSGQLDFIGFLLTGVTGLWAVTLLLRDVKLRLRPYSLDPRVALGARLGRSSISRTLSFVGFGLFLASAPTVLASRTGSPIRRALHMSESSRSPAGGPPPPQPLARDRGISDGRDAGRDEPGSCDNAAGGGRSGVSPVHPAIHRVDDASIRIHGPLFDRSGRRVGHERTIDVERARGRERAMRIHPAGRGLKEKHNLREHDNRSVHEAKAPKGARTGCGSERGGAGERAPESTSRTEHVVRSGESLWSIAESVLQTSDLRRIARYWPLIHKANAALIGRDPSRVFPGQRLTLPPEKDV